MIAILLTAILTSQSQAQDFIKLLSDETKNATLLRDEISKVGGKVHAGVESSTKRLKDLERRIGLLPIDEPRKGTAEINLSRVNELFAEIDTPYCEADRLFTDGDGSWALSDDVRQTLRDRYEEAIRGNSEYGGCLGHLREIEPNVTLLLGKIAALELFLE